MSAVAKKASQFVESKTAISDFGFITYSHVVTPISVWDNESAKYRIQLAFPDSQAVDAAIDEAIKAKWPTRKPSELKRPYRDGALIGASGMQVAEFSLRDSGTPPQVLDMQSQPVNGKLITPGCSARVSFIAMAYTTNDGKHKVSLKLNNVQVDTATFGNAPFRNSQLGLPVLPANIPVELISLDRWVNWSYDLKVSGPKHPKYPIDPLTSRMASVTNPKQWRSYAECLRHYLAGKFDGVGFVLADGQVGVDLDNCRDPSTGQLNQFAQGIVQQLATYTEVSPSATGIKMICTGSINGEHRSKGSNVEVYSTDRYFTITGQSLPNTPQTLRVSGQELQDMAAANLPDLTDENRARTLVREKVEAARASGVVIDVLCPLRSRLSMAEAALRNITHQSSNDGSQLLILSASAVKRYGIPVETAVKLLQAKMTEKGFSWSDDAIEARYDQANAIYGEAIFCPELAGAKPELKEVAPEDAAKMIIERSEAMLYYKQDFYGWGSGKYQPIDDEFSVFAASQANKLFRNNTAPQLSSLAVQLKSQLRVNPP